MAALSLLLQNSHHLVLRVLSPLAPIRHVILTSPSIMATAAHKQFFTDESYSFFSLPPELRCKVYNYLMNNVDEESDPFSYNILDDDEHPNVVPAARDCQRKAHVTRGSRDSRCITTRVLHVDTDGIHKVSLTSQLLRTCRIIYEEAGAALYGSRVVHGSRFHDHVKPLHLIGEQACKFIEVIIIHPCIVPKRLVLKNKRELRALGLRAPTPKLLPPLPKLDYVTFSYAAGSHNSQLEMLEFVDELMASKSSRHHFLSEYIWMIGSNPRVQWRFELLSWIYGLFPHPRTPGILLYGCMDELLIEMHVVESMTEAGEKTWLVKNADGTNGVVVKHRDT